MTCSGLGLRTEGVPAQSLKAYSDLRPFGARIGLSGDSEWNRAAGSLVSALGLRAALLTKLIVMALRGPQLCLCLTTFAILWKGMTASSHHRRLATTPIHS